MKKKIDDNFDLTKESVLEQVLMQQDGKGFLYYITKVNNVCTLMEGNPRDPYIKNHYPIASVNTPKCLSFGIQGNDRFFIMGANHNMHLYERNLNNRTCHQLVDLNIKEIQRLDFPSEDFNVSILDEKFAIYKDMIFYFYEREPYPPGVFEAEHLIEQDLSNDMKVYLKGPFTFTGNNRFYNVLR